MHCILDAYFRELCNDGVGAEEKKSSLVSGKKRVPDWENGMLDVNTPERLLFLQRPSAFMGGTNTVLSKYLKLLSTPSLLCTIFTQRMGLK